MNWMNNIPLATMAQMVGGMLAALSVPAFLAPEPSRRGLTAFSRNVQAGWLFAAVDMVWVAWLVLDTSLGRFDYLKPAIYVVAPVCFFMLVNYLDEMLASRALGGLLLLVANPILYSARWHESALRLVMSVLAYAIVVAGMTLVLSPYRFRDAISVLAPTPARCRLLGLSGLVLGGAVLALGVFVY